MYQNSGLRVPPEMFNNAKNKILEIIAWANTECGHVTSREFNELLSGYLTTEHFAFIESGKASPYAPGQEGSFK